MPCHSVHTALALVVIGGLPACTAGPPSPSRDAASIKEEYHRLEQQAQAEIRAWGASSEPLPDPRPSWAGKLETLASAHPDAPEAAAALQGAMQLRGASGDIEGFFKAYEMLLRIAPDAPGLSSVFEEITAVRLKEAGGPGIMADPDDEARRRAYRKAAPRIAADIERALAAARKPATLAAAHQAIGETWFLLDLDLGKALEHFRIVAARHPDSPYAPQAREYVAEIEKLGPGRPAPDFEAKALGGAKIRLSELKGRIVLVDFWATWCMPCLVEMPGLKRAYEKYKERGFTIIGVSLESDAEAVAGFVSENGMTWPIVVDGAEGRTATGPIAGLYNVQTIPMSYLVDRDGTIRARRLLGADVERAVADLLGRQAAAPR